MSVVYFISFIRWVTCMNISFKCRYGARHRLELLWEETRSFESFYILFFASTYNSRFVHAFKFSGICILNKCLCVCLFLLGLVAFTIPLSGKGMYVHFLWIYQYWSIGLFKSIHFLYRSRCFYTFVSPTDKYILLKLYIYLRLYPPTDMHFFSFY